MSTQFFDTLPFESVEQTISSFPTEFSLTHLPSDTFRINRDSSYLDTEKGEVVLVVDIFDDVDNSWEQAWRGSESELKEILIDIDYKLRKEVIIREF